MERSDDGGSERPAAPPALVAALRHLLRPVVRLLIATHVPFPQLASLLKAAYVEVALRDFPIAGKRQTDSRLSLLTGVHRKDVRRLRDQPAGVHRSPRAVSLGAQIVARWTGLAAYHDAEGRPRPLPRVSTSKRAASFESLVASVSKDIRPRAVLDEWLRLGVAHLDAEDRVCLNAEAFVPARGFREKAYYFGRNLHDHVAAAAHNLAGDGPPLLDRSVHYSSLTPESVAELSKLATRAAMEAVQSVNRRALELQKRDAGKRAARHRMNFGVYFYRADASDEESWATEEPDGG